ncbi:hypothetical protein Dimus_003043 [Dionaea muscipula]
MTDKIAHLQKMMNIKKEKHEAQLREKKWIPPGNVQSVAQKLAQKRKHPTDIFEGVHERQQLTIGRRSSPRKKQVHGPQNPLDGEAHTEEAAEIAERRVHERGRSQYHNQNQLIGELLQEDQTLEGRQSKERMTRELHRDEEIEFTKSKVLS